MPPKTSDQLSTLPPDSLPEQVALGDASLDDRGFEARYSRGALIGQGGMGEVRLYRDERIGREVAMKVIRGALADNAELRRRFVREARVQGQLEHPSVVPVHDLGVGADGAVWFTMKRIRGRTLGEVIRALRHGDAEVASQWTERRLLSSLSSLCLAVDFAHEKGVVHRDLKPANVMLGDFGEVYLLDWGLARVVAESEADGGGASAGDSARELVSGPGGVGSGHAEGPSETATGVVLGSPGYMSPEQVRGEPATTASDVYSLGVMLFELLTYERMNRGSSAEEARLSALVAAEPPSERAPGRQIAPELDVICARATALEPAERYPSARAMNQAIERFLDGDRDAALRRELASRHVELARVAVEEAERASGPELESQARERALREAGQAVALDPGSEAAKQLMVQLLMKPPRTVPAEARSEIEEAAAAQEREAQRGGAGAIVAISLGTLMVLTLGLRSPLLFGVIMLLNGISFTLNVVASRSASRSRLLIGALVLTNGVNVAASTRSMGPFAIAPLLATVSTMGYLLATDRRMHRFIVVTGLTALLAPFALELLHVLPPSYQFRDGNIVILPQMHDLPEVGTTLFLVVLQGGLLLAMSLLVMRLRRTLDAAQERVHLHAWSLGRFLPRDALKRADPEERGR